MPTIVKRLTQSSADPLLYLRTMHSNMMARCYRKTDPSYKYYGGRGIKVCQEWHSVKGFIEGILASIGHRPPGISSNTGLSLYQLDRISSFKDYCPDNVRWATMEQNQANKRPAKNRREPFPGYQISFVNSSCGYLTFESHPMRATE
jgi:hypothetical protein